MSAKASWSSLSRRRLLGAFASAAGLAAAIPLLQACGGVPPAAPRPTSVGQTSVAVEGASSAITSPPTALAGSSTSPEAVPTGSAAGSENPCGLAAIVAPTPAPYPGYTQVDPSTGLHVTVNSEPVDLATYRLRLTGAVDHPLDLTYEQIRCLPTVQASTSLICPGFFEDHATWTGTPIAEVLALAKVQKGAQFVESVSVDGHTSSLPLEQAIDRANFLAYQWEGQPLPRLHGFPVRVVAPGVQGSSWAKWVVEISVGS